MVVTMADLFGRWTYFC